MKEIYKGFVDSFKNQQNIEDGDSIMMTNFDATDGSQIFPDERGKYLYPWNSYYLPATRSNKFDQAAFFGNRADQYRCQLLMLNDTAFEIGTDDFVVDCWLSINYYRTYDQTIIDIGSQYNSKGLCIYYYANNIYVNMNGTGLGSVTMSEETFIYGKWYHVAVVRSDETVYVFQDGVLCGTLADAGPTNIDIGTYNVSVGLRNRWDSTDWALRGAIDELRVSVGTDRGWTSSFLPPTSPYTSDAYTACLLHMDATPGPVFEDSSDTNF